jgi:hypothetical protein
MPTANNANSQQANSQQANSQQANSQQANRQQATRSTVCQLAATGIVQVRTAQAAGKIERAQHN